MKSNRYRFWRMFFFLGACGLLGFVMGYLGATVDLSSLPRFQIDWDLVQWLLLILAGITFAVTLYYLAQTRKAARLLETLSEDEEIEEADKTANRAYNIAAILSALLSVMMFVEMSILMTSIVGDSGSLSSAGGTVAVSVLALFSIRLIRLHFKDVHGQEMPKNMNVKETQAFLLSFLDEAEKQVQYEENFELVLKLSAYVIPCIYIVLFALRMFFGLDIMLTVMIVSVLYVYILISQYRIVKRYYK